MDIPCHEMPEADRYRMVFESFYPEWIGPYSAPVRESYSGNDGQAIALGPENRRYVVYIFATSGPDEWIRLSISSESGHSPTELLLIAEKICESIRRDDTGSAS